MLRKILHLKNREENLPNLQNLANLSPNLLTPIEAGDFKERINSKIIPLTTFVVTTLGFCFFAFILVNLFLNQKLEKLEKTRDELVLEIDMKAGIAQKLSDNQDLLAIYKTKKQTRKVIAPVLKLLMEKINERVSMDSLSYSSEKGAFHLRARADTPVKYAYLFSDLLATGQVQSIVIESVALQGGKREYLSSLEIFIK